MTRSVILAALAVATLLPAPEATASEAAARQAAKQANCQPNKVEAVRQRLGEAGETVYRVTCAPAVKAAPKDQSVLVQCRGPQCILLR